MTTPCPGAGALRASWTARSLAGALLDLALAWACLCLAALAAATTRALTLLGLPLLPCTCARPHLPCLHAFLARYPPRALASVHAALRARFPFAAVADHHPEADEEEEEKEQPSASATAFAAAAELQRELEKERSAAASAAEEAMAMILRLQKDKSALEIEARQQRRTADERCAFYEDEVEELRDIVLLREREARALRKEVDAYRRLLGLGPAAHDEEEEDDDEEDEQEMVTPHSVLVSECINTIHMYKCTIIQVTRAQVISCRPHEPHLALYYQDKCIYIFNIHHPSEPICTTPTCPGSSSRPYHIYLLIYPKPFYN